MLFVKYYDSTVDLTGLLKELGEIKVIVPSPADADQFRTFVQSSILDIVEVMTISKWIGDFKLPDNAIRARKVELMQILANYWVNYYPDGEYNFFENSFELFTELRSFSLSPEVLGDVLAELDPELQKSLMLFWAILNMENIYDEHALYHIAGDLNHGDVPLLFSGFKFLSGVQIEMIKKMAEKSDIYICIPRSVKVSAKATDWVNWIDTLEIKSSVQIENSKNKIAVTYYTSQNLVNTLTHLEESILQGNELIFAHAQLDFLNIQSFHHFGKDRESTHSFVTAEVLFEDKWKDLNLWLAKLIQNQHTMDQIIEGVQNELSQSVVLQDFRKYKVYQLAYECLLKYKKSDSVFTKFDRELVSEVVRLNLPRNYIIAPSDQGIFYKLFSSIKYSKKSNVRFIIFQKENQLFKVDRNDELKKIRDLLKNIGPLKRTELDSLFYQAELIHFAQENEVHFIIDQELIDTDPLVKTFLNSFQIENVEINQLEFKENGKSSALLNGASFQVPISPTMDSQFFSASKIQLFLDCPLKYFYKYKLKWDERDQLRSGVPSDERGVLEHKIIQNYVERNEQYNYELLKVLVIETLRGHCEEKRIKLNHVEYFSLLFELIDYTQRGILKIYQLMKDKPQSKIHFEYSLPPNEWNLKGSIDCLLVGLDGASILDFKRSSAATGTKAEWFEFQKVQLWIYALVMKKHLIIKEMMAINLSEDGRDLIIDNEVDLNLEKFESFLNIKLNEIKSEEHFIAKPRSEKICHFCIVNELCSKGGAHE